MAKTNSDLIRELSDEASVHREQLRVVLKDVEALKADLKATRTELGEVEANRKVLQSQLEDVRGRLADFEIRWRWLIATFFGLLISVIVALLRK